MSDARRETYDRLVRDWARPVYGLACRMLRHRADADDATQEVFLRLWERIDLYDASRPFQPWIYRVATHVVLNRIRGEKTRVGKESKAPARESQESHESAEDAVERREREEIVQQGLARLDPESRSLLAMHYYGGLSQEQVAEVLDVPRTTVQSRLGKALESLRVSLKGAGHLAILPGLEEAMRASTPPPIPESLLSSLFAVGTPAALIAAPIIGGIIVTKKLLMAAAVLAALTLGGGFAAGYAVRGSRAEDSLDAPPSLEMARLANENRRLADELSKRSAAPTLAPSGNAKPVVASGADSTAAAASAGATSEPASTEDPSKAAVDWSKFGALFAANADRIIAMMEVGKERGEDTDDLMKPADKQMVMGLLSEYMRSSMSAQALSQHPFYDERVLPGLVVAVYGDTLGLSKEKRASLTSELRALVTAQGKALEFDRMGPVETFVARQKSVAEVLAAVGTAAGPDAKEKFEKLREFGASMLGGDHAEVRLGWDGKASASSVGERVLERWKEAYGLDDKQSDAVRPIADRYAQDAMDVLRRRGIDKGDLKARDAARDAAGLEMMGLQATADRSINTLLNDKQREEARSEPPTLVVVLPGEGTRISSSSWGGI